MLGKRMLYGRRDFVLLLMTAITGRRAQYRTIWIKVEIILTKRTTQNGRSFVRLLGTSLIARPNARTSIHISSRSQLKQDVPGKVGQ